MRKLTTVLAGLICAPMLVFAPEARADLDAVAKAMGSPTSLQFSGSGLNYGVGQAYRPSMPWPRMNLVSYSRTDDYANGAQSFDTTINRADQLGGTGTPARGNLRRGGGVAGDQAWSILYPVTDPVVAAAVPLQHDLWIAPHGIVRAAIVDKATMNGSTFSVERAGKFKARATVNNENLVTRVESWVANPVLGDMAVVTVYSDYKDHGGVKFPGKIEQWAGGNQVLELNVTEVKVNPGSVTAPAQIAVVPSEVKVEKAADGVWFVSGGSHNSAIIEMRDYVILFEAPLGDARTNAVIQAVKDTVPNKPIRYAVASHHHFDHSGGLRAAAAEGATLVVPEMAKIYFEQAYTTPHTLSPDSLAKSGKQVKFESYSGDKHVISDGSRSFELHLIKNNIHADGYIMGYLPKEKIMLVADAFSPRAPITQTPAVINVGTKNLWDNIQLLKLDIETVLPMHGRMVKVEELKIEVGAR